MLLPLAAAAAALAAAPAALAGPGLFIGTADDGAVWGDASSQMALAQQAGFDSARLTAQWVSGNTKLDPVIASKLRVAVAAAQAHGIRPVVSIYNVNSVQAPGDPILRGEFAQFAQDVVTTLPAVKTFIVGNEPNSSYYWQPQFDTRGGDLAAVNYEALLADTYDAIKAVRPDATVIGGALDSMGTDNPKTRPSHSPLVFIADMGRAYRASKRTRPIMDVFDQHVYEESSSLPPSMTHRSSSTIGIADYPKLVAALAQAFGGNLPIVYGEYGVESIIPPAEASHYNGHENATAKPVDEATQAAYYRQAIQLAFCDPTVKGFFVFHAIDEKAMTGWQSGVYYPDDTPKTSLAGVKAAMDDARRGIVAQCPSLGLTPKATVTQEGPVLTMTCDLDCSYVAQLYRGAGKLIVSKHGRAVGGTPTTLPFRVPRAKATYRLRVSLLAPVNPGKAGLLRRVVAPG